MVSKMTESCADYWEAQGIDPLDAALTVGCRVGDNATPSFNGNDIIGAVIFLLTLAVLAAIALQGNPPEDKHDIFR